MVKSFDDSGRRGPGACRSRPAANCKQAADAGLDGYGRSPRTTSTPSRWKDEPFFPGDEEIERRYRRLIRWNAAVMVHRAQRPGIGVGGHISTYAGVGHASTRSASTTSSAARTTAAAATRSSSRATPRPACTPGRSWRAG